MDSARTVAVVVPSPAMSEVLEATSRTSWAPTFSRASLSSISFATVTPSLVESGEPNLFSRTTLRPLGPRVTLTASASLFTPRRIDWRQSSEYVISLAAILAAPLSCSVYGLADDAENVLLTHDDVLDVVDRDLVARVLAEQDLVPGLHIEWDALAVLVQLAGPDGDDGPFLWLLLGGVGDDDPALASLLFLESLDQDAVVERLHLHCVLLNLMNSVCLARQIDIHRGRALIL